MIRLAIVGSSRLTPAEALVARDVVGEVVDRYAPDEVVSGGADFIDRFAREEALRRGIGGPNFLPEVRRWDGGDKVGFKQRNIKIAEYCTHLVRIVSRKTQTYGSGWTRDRAKEIGKHTEEIVLLEGALK